MVVLVWRNSSRPEQGPHAPRTPVARWLGLDGLGARVGHWGGGLGQHSPTLPAGRVVLGRPRPGSRDEGPGALGPDEQASRGPVRGGRAGRGTGRWCDVGSGDPNGRRRPHPGRRPRPIGFNPLALGQHHPHCHQPSLYHRCCHEKLYGAIGFTGEGGIGPRRTCHGQSQRAGSEDGLRPGALRPGLGGRRPQWLRHPQRRPSARPQCLRSQDWHGCLVLSGTLQDPYTAMTIMFVRGQSTSAKVQIDHVVALSDAWQKGAQQWSTQRRTAFANDSLNLLAVDGPTNARKGDGDAATWLPPNKAYRCSYAARQVAVKVKYGLWVTGAEGEALTRILAACPSQKLPTAAPFVLRNPGY